MACNFGKSDKVYAVNDFVIIEDFMFVDFLSQFSSLSRNIMDYLCMWAVTVSSSKFLLFQKLLNLFSTSLI